MKEKYICNQENLKHLELYNHFTDKYEEKPVCKYGDECKSYIRNERGQDENRIHDQCHMIIYRHPPRTRSIKLAQNLHPLILNQKYNQNHPVYKPTDEDKQKYGMKEVGWGSWENRKNKIDGWLYALIDEVISNGYKYDLCMQCSKDEDCKHDVYDSIHSILHIVDKKMEHTRHKMIDSPLTRDQMLALILYTGLSLSLQQNI